MYYILCFSVGLILGILAMGTITISKTNDLNFKNYQIESRYANNFIKMRKVEEYIEHRNDDVSQKIKTILYTHPSKCR